MAGIYTNQRVLRNPWSTDDRTRWITYTPGHGYPLSRYSYQVPSAFQATTSFRSGGAYGRLEDTPQGLLSESERQTLRPYDTGHEFHTTKCSIFATHKDYEVRGTNGAYYRGGLFPNGINYNVDLDSLYHLPEIDITKGTNAIRNTMPTKAAANVAQALSELIVDLPAIPFRALEKALSPKSLLRSAGKEYLGVNFAWAPLVSDVLKICKAIVNSNDILQQYMRDSGRQVRRGFDYPKKEEVLSNVVTNDASLFFFSWNYDNPYDFIKSYSDSLGTLTVRETVETKYWFRGAYMYYADEGNTFFGQMQTWANKADKLLGVKLDVETLWELAPWSWLADWFANIGDLIAINNSIANDNLVIRYGYLMRTITYRKSHVHSGVRFKTGATGPIEISYNIVDKQRVRATPYGFGLNTDAFSDAQWAIIGALGLSKAPKKMWWG